MIVKKHNMHSSLPRFDSKSYYHQDLHNTSISTSKKQNEQEVLEISVPADTVHYKSYTLKDVVISDSAVQNVPPPPSVEVNSPPPLQRFATLPNPVEPKKRKEKSKKNLQRNQTENLDTKIQKKKEKIAVNSTAVTIPKRSSSQNLKLQTIFSNTKQGISTVTTPKRQSSHQKLRPIYHTENFWPTSTLRHSPPPHTSMKRNSLPTALKKPSPNLLSSRPLSIPLILQSHQHITEFHTPIEEKEKNLGQVTMKRIIKVVVGGGDGIISLPPRPFFKSDDDTNNLVTLGKRKGSFHKKDMVEITMMEEGDWDKSAIGYGTIESALRPLSVAWLHQGDNLTDRRVAI